MVSTNRRGPYPENMNPFVRSADMRTKRKHHKHHKINDLGLKWVHQDPEGTISREYEPLRRGPHCVYEPLRDSAWLETVALEGAKVAA